MKSFIKNNISIILYVVIAVILELTTNLMVCGNILIYEPWFALSLLFFIVAIMLFCKKGTTRYYIASSLIFVQGLINIFCVILYDMTGTLFDFGMLNLRRDGMGILESIPMNFTYLYIYMLLFSSYLIFVKPLAKKEEMSTFKVKTILTYFLVFAMAVTNVLCIFKINNTNENYKDRLYNSGNNYQAYGATSNLINQIYKGLFFTSIEKMHSSTIDSFIYEDVSNPTEYFGVSEGNNLITILAESFEWMTFIIDTENYPNGLYNLTQEDINYLFPNLTYFYNNGVSMVNNYAREKTDISENLSIIGSYPTDVYINYDYPTNTSPFTLPSILKSYDGDIQNYSFHNGYSSFYNRKQSIVSLGFDKFFGMEDMFEMSDSYETPTMVDHASKGERNLDSEMIETCKDLMFPTDKRFYTYITSITMHGFYYERDNLKRWFDKLDSINALPVSENDDMKNDFRNYIAAAMEFDHAIGLIIEDLTKKDLLDKTTIVIFGDHNAYYEGLSNYVKDIYDYDEENYTNLYRTPLMILDSNLESQKITKFTTVYDIVPTVLDLFGYKYYTNLYYGNSVFSDEASILYSRAYDIFLTDKIYFSSLNRILYKNESVDDAYIDEMEIKALEILEKLEYINNIFYQDYFKNGDNYNKFISMMNEIN